MTGVRTPYEGSGHRTWDPDARIDAPLRLHRTTVPPDWVDYNGHMSESCYLLAFGDSADAFFRFVGVDEDYRAGGHSLFTVQTHLHHRSEASLGDPLRLSLRVLDHDDRRLHLYHEMHVADAGADGRRDRLVAAAEQLLVHVDIAAGRSAPMPPDLLDHVSAVRLAHAALPRADLVGRPLAIRHRA
jgi:carnitine 3-dehydrogenase